MRRRLRDLIWFGLIQTRAQGGREGSRTSNLADPDADLPLASVEDEDVIAGRGGGGDACQAWPRGFPTAAEQTSREEKSRAANQHSTHSLHVT